MKLNLGMDYTCNSFSIVQLFTPILKGLLLINHLKTIDLKTIAGPLAIPNQHLKHFSSSKANVCPLP